jgi:outer membrane biosynthesis protein TonB
MPQLPKLVIPADTPKPKRVVAFIKPSQPFLRKVPILRALGKSGDSFVPANPLEHPLPPGATASDAEGQDAVELAARIDRSGKVTHVKTLQGSKDLARASAAVLYRWKFEPARQNGAPVDSEMLVRFEFGETPQ